MSAMSQTFCLLRQVIENLFCDRKIINKYDLKGSERNRLVDPSVQTGETVLLDENLIKGEL